MGRSSRSAAKKLTVKEKRQAQMIANRKAQLQWYALGGFFATAVVATIVIISVFTEGELPVYGHG